jgi:Lrp/AsnC family leucine-responsive transcriptional regulator
MNIKENYQKILFELEKDSRKKFTEIGESVGLSQQTVSYAVKSMEENNIISGYRALFDYTKFGYNGYIVLFRVNAFSREKIEELKSLLKEQGMTASIDRLSGGWDLRVFFLAPNASQFNKEFKELISEYPDQLRNYKILTSVVIHDLGREYLVDGDQSSEDIIIGGDREQVNVKETWKDVAEIIWNSPRRKSVEIAEDLDVTPKTVIDRLERLDKEKLVKGFRPNVGIEDLGITTHLLFVKYNNRNVDMENDLRDYCVDHPNVVKMTKTFGDYDAVIRIETEDRGEQREVINSIRERYEEILLDYNTLEVVEEISRRYLPQSYFEGEEFPED